MSGIHAVVILLAEAGTAENGFQFWLDGEPIVDVGDGSMAFWIDGEPELTEED